MWMIKNRKNGIHSNQQHYSTWWDKFPDARKVKEVESVMKYCSSEMMGGIVAYRYHMGDEFSKVFDFHQADLVHVHTHGRSHFTLFMSLKL
jgi:hypothetical protein